MKNIIFTAILLFSISINAQVYQTFSMHFVKVEGDLKAFETVQSEYMQKVAQNAVNNGDIAFWAFLKRHTWDGINDEDRSNYLFVQSNTDVSAILNPKNSWWNNAANVLSKEEQAIVEALNSKYTWKADGRAIFQDEVSIANGLGTHIQFNFAKPKNLTGFISENKSLWKNYFSKNMSNLKMVNWGVGRKLAPIGMNYSDVVTWDMFDSLESLMKYRAEFSLPSSLVKKSKMNSYNPDGWRNQPIFKAIKFAVAEQ